MIRTCGSALALVLSVCAVMSSAQEPAWRLLMFDAHDCSFCASWDEEVGVIYAKTDEGRLAPLERRELMRGAPEGVTLAQPVSYTPTFVLLSRGGRELGRITGYPGEDHFWGLLGALQASAARP